MLSTLFFCHLCHFRHVFSDILCQISTRCGRSQQMKIWFFPKELTVVCTAWVSSEAAVHQVRGVLTKSPPISPSLYLSLSFPFIPSPFLTPNPAIDLNGLKGNCQMAALLETMKQLFPRAATYAYSYTLVPKWPILCRDTIWTLNPTHSLTPSSTWSCDHSDETASGHLIMVSRCPILSTCFGYGVYCM